MEVETRELTAKEAKALVNSLQDLINWESDEVEELSDPKARATARKILESVQDLINPFQ